MWIYSRLPPLFFYLGQRLCAFIYVIASLMSRAKSYHTQFTATAPTLHLRSAASAIAISNVHSKLDFCNSLSCNFANFLARTVVREPITLIILFLVLHFNFCRAMRSIAESVRVVLLLPIRFWSQWTGS